MQLLSKPVNYDFKKGKKYEQFNIAKIAFTERNWIGEGYITKEQCQEFLNDFRKIDEVFFNKEMKGMADFLNFTLLIDTSVFYKPEENQVNEKLVTLLNEISAFKIEENMDISKQKEMNKKLKKVRTFLNKLENSVYLYDWAIKKPTHPFSDILRSEIENNIKEQGIRSKNQWKKDIKDREPVHKKWLKQGYTIAQIEELDAAFQQNIIMKCERRDSEFAEKMFRHSVQNPLLFFYSIYFLILYFQETAALMNSNDPLGPEEFLIIEKKDSNIHVFLKDSHRVLSELFLRHEVFHSSLPRVKRTGSGIVNKYSSLHDLSEEIENLDESYIEVLKTITQWVISRIPENTVTTLPKEKWLHPIKGVISEKLHARYLFFEGHQFIGGPKGKELLIKARCFKQSNDNKYTEDILFPLFDPNSWENLNPSQCALLAYACCLYHDICIEGNYELERNTINSQRGIFEYLLYTKENNKTTQPLKTNLFSPSKVKEENDKKINEKEERLEHWVSFHFRRLRKNQKASDTAKEKAKKYGINKLPPGFTFVDSFVKGEKTEDVSKMKISALEVFNKTIQKVSEYQPTQELVE